jgi:uncharacterized protein
VGYALRMSAEIRAWLAGLRDDEPITAGESGGSSPRAHTAAAVWHALVTLADIGPELGSPTVVMLGKPPCANPVEALDYAYQERLERLRQVRHAMAAERRAASGEERAADADDYLAMQAEADAFRVRKEVLKSRYTAALAEESVARFIADAAAESDDGDLAHYRRAIAEQAERVRAVTADIERELGLEPWPDGLFELRPAVPGRDVRLIFAVEPADAVLVISVLEGRDAVSEQHGRAVGVSAKILRQVRAGQDPEASAVEFVDGRQFARAFVAGHGDTGQPKAGEARDLTVAWLPFPLAPEGYPPCKYQVADGSLVMTGAAATDMFVDPAGAGAVPDAGRLAGPPPDGDFTLAARVTVDFGSSYDAGVLLLHAGERLWAKLCFELSPQRKPTAVTVVTRGTSDDCNSFNVDGRTLWLRMTRSGTAWAFHASTDGDWWRLLRYFSLGDGDPVKVGFLAQSPTGQGCTAAFERIAFRAGAPSDLRDGS